MNKMMISLVFLTMILACNRTDPYSQNDFEGNTTTIQINIAGMTCTGCEETITNGVTSLEGVQNATADYTQGKAWVAYDDTKVNAEKLTEVIEQKGYQVIDFESYPQDSTIVQLK